MRQSSRPVRRGSARSQGCIRSTSAGCSRRPRTRSGRSSCSRDSVVRCARAAPTSRRTASTTSITTGADPLIFLDYMAANRIELEQVAELVEGAAEVCRDAGVAFVGGETAELPGIYRDEELDFAGHVRRHRRARRARSTARGCGRETSSSACPPRACTRTGSRSSAASSRTRTTTARTCSPRRAATWTTCGGCDRARTPSRTSRGAASRATSRASSRTGLARQDRLGRLGAAARLSTGSPTTWTRTSCGASSTSGSATARSSPDPGDDLVIGRIEARDDRGARVGRGDEPPGTARRGAAGGRRRVEQARCAGARARAGGRCADTRSSRSRTTRIARTRDRALGLLARASRERRWPCSPGTCTCSTTPFLELFPDRIVNVHPSLLPKYPGMHAIEDALAAGETSTRRDRPLRRRGRRLGPDHRAGSRGDLRERHRRHACERASSRSSTGSCRAACRSTSKARSVA